MKITALDLSLTATGYAIGSSEDPTAWRWKPEQLGTIATADHRGMHRLDLIRRRVLELVDGADVVVLEGYAYGSKRQSHTRAIAELGGVIRMTLYDLGFPYVEVPPASLKKYATGKGNAGKSDVLVEAVKRLEYNGSDHNEADALWLLEMALDEYGIIEGCVPQTHREALEKVEWPALTKHDESGRRR